jgi:hypothetical protein
VLGGIALLLAGLLVPVALSLTGPGTRRAVGEPALLPEQPAVIAVALVAHLLAGEGPPPARSTVVP